MRGSKGSILAITMGFTLIFTMLGTASIYISTLHTETQEKQILNHQAFWLAEAGINKAIVFLHSVTPASVILNPIIDDESLGIVNEIIDRVDITGPNLPNPPWTIDSIGKANNQRRHIQVTADRTSFDFNYALTTGSADINKPDEVIDGEWQVKSVTFDEIFGIPIEEMRNRASNLYEQLRDNNENSVVAEEITWITLADGNELFSPGNWGGSGFLVVNGNMKLTSNGSFNGILWVTGDLEIEGTPDIIGSVFVQGETTINSATVAITNNPDTTIQDAPIALSSWKEIGI